MSPRFHIDPPTPRNFSRTGTTHIISGWYADHCGQPARAVRLLIGKHIVSCSAVSRPDVQKHFQGTIEMDHFVGFRAIFRTGKGIKLIRAQILDEKGVWVTLARRFIWANPQKKLSEPAQSTRTRSPSSAPAPEIFAPTSTFQSGLDGLWQSCRGVKLSHSEGTCPITWVIPDFNEGGGGHLNIFRMIKNLEELGAPAQQVLIIGHHSKKDRFKAEDEVRKYFFSTKAHVYLHTDNLPRTEAMVATCWQTAYFVKEQPGHLKKFYFVQDYEPLFFAAGSNALLAANTYRFGFATITAGHWLKKILERDYNNIAVSYNFSYDKHLYRSTDRETESYEYDIFFYARPFTERRMFDLGVAAIDEAIKKAGRPLKVAFAGSSLPPNCTPFPFTNLGVLSLNELSELYGKLRCSLVLSATNASLLPYELMACGCPVVTNQGENNEWLFPEGYAGVAANTPSDLGGLMADICTTPDLRRRLSLHGLEIVSTTDWIHGARDVLSFIKQQLRS
jgi:O-antigen biosynthesis protein